MWTDLIEKDIVEILDGDKEIGSLDIDGSNISLKMPYLSGWEICKLGHYVNKFIPYYDKEKNTKSRWQYFFDVLEAGIDKGTINSLLNYLFSKEHLKVTIDNLEDSSLQYREGIPKVRKLALTAINDKLYLKDKMLYLKNKNWNLTEKASMDTSKNESKIEKRGFYILPFEEKYIDIMEAIKDEIKKNSYNLQLAKSGDIFNPLASRNIVTNIRDQIENADLLVVDISKKNPNVFYELGIAVALNKKIISICSEESRIVEYNKVLPFDIAADETIFYEEGYRPIKKLAIEVGNRINAILNNKKLIHEN